MNHPALTLAVLLASAAPSLAAPIEAVADGVRFRIPDGTAFFTPLPNGGVQAPDRLQAALDGNRGTDGTGRALLFTSVPAAGLEGEPPPNTIVMRRVPGVPALDVMDATIARIGSHARFVDGIAEAGPGEAPATQDGRTDYLVRTGVGYAPLAWVTCHGHGERCSASMPLGDGMALAFLNMPGGEVGGMPAVRGRLAEAIRFAVPDGLPGR